MSSLERFNSLVYPIHGRILFEVDDVLNLREIRCSDKVKVGKCEWCIKVNSERSHRTGNEKFLSAYLTCVSVIAEGKTVAVDFQLRLINQQNSGKDHAPQKSINIKYTNESSLWGRPCFIEWSRLLSEGYVKNEKILVECVFYVNSETGIKRRSINFKEERPNEEDLKMILETKKFSSNVAHFEEEIEVSKIAGSTEEDCFTTTFTLFGLPAKLSLHEMDLSVLRTSLYLNWEDESDWWRCHATVGFRIVNQDDGNLSTTKSLDHVYRKSVPSVSVSFDKWDDPTNNHVKNGKLRIRVSLRIIEAYGFAETAKKVFEKPMKKMTNILLANCSSLKSSKKILAQQSPVFRRYFNSHVQSSRFEIRRMRMDSTIIRFLELVHNVDTDIDNSNAEYVLRVIEQYNASECFERIDLILKEQELKWIQVEWVNKYPLPELKRKLCLKLKNDTFWETFFHSAEYKSLYDLTKVAILELKVAPEKSKLEDTKDSYQEFSTNFQMRNDLSDIEIKVGDHSYHASKQILANASYFFMKRFYGPYSEDETIVSDLDVTQELLEMLLEHIYHPTRPVTDVNLESLLQLAHQFSVLRLMDKCEEYLVLNDSIPLIEKLEYAGKYDLPFLLSACLKFAKDDEKMKEIKSHQKFPMLSSKVLAELWKREIEETSKN